MMGLPIREDIARALSIHAGAGSRPIGYELRSEALLAQMSELIRIRDGEQIWQENIAQSKKSRVR
jgi:hypothetical protein